MTPREQDPSATPSIPESAPKGGIKVEYRQPELLHAFARNVIGYGDNQRLQVSNIGIDDDLIASETTELGWSESVISDITGVKIAGTFYYETSIMLAPKRKAQADHGYYSSDKISRINDILVAAGTKTVADTTSLAKYGRMVIDKDDFFVEVSFGPPNRKAGETLTLAIIEAEKKEGKRGYATISCLPRINKGLKEDNGSILLSLVDRVRAESEEKGYPQVKDQADFARATQAYVESYQQVLAAIYAEEGITPQEKTIILRPPVINSDAFTQIASTRTSFPTVVTPEQIRTEHISFEEIAGQDVAVAEAKRLVLAINHPEVFEQRGVKRPKGILFYGPPGTGKTLIAKAIARGAKATFFEIYSADIGTKWYGESERLMQEVFTKANDAAGRGKKVVLFFDELDALAPSREGAHEATKKVVATLLQNMDGMRANRNVTVIAATNRPQDIDPALKRPGRFDKLIFVGLPSPAGRVAILKVHMEKARKAATLSGDLFSQDIDLGGQLAQVTDGMSGADLANLVNLTLEEKTMAELEGQSWTPVTTEDMVNVARRLGLLKEEKRRIGFSQPEPRINGENGQTSAKQIPVDNN